MTALDASSPTAGTAPVKTGIAVHSPADRRDLGQVAVLSRAEVGGVADRLRAGQAAWAAAGVKDRVRWMGGFRDWLLDHADHLAGLLAAETGKPRAEADLEFGMCIDVLNYYSSHAGSFLAEEHPRPHGPLTAAKQLSVTYQPHPLVGVITPWNFPLGLSLFDAIPALLAGAAVIVKPSEYTPLAITETVGGWSEIGAPDVFGCVNGLAETGAAVVDEVDYLQFTGSTRTGRLIAQRAGERLIPVGLELGGKDAAIVLADADLDLAARGVAFGGLANAGQMCTSVERVYVEAPAYDEFVQRLVALVDELREGVDIGPLVNAAQLEIVIRHVEEAVADGAQALTGGKASEGTFYPPTVLVDVDHSMACIREESFGPTLPIVKVADAEEAIRLANDSSYGLSATVWTRDVKRGKAIARRIEAGAVNVNDVAANLMCFPVPQAGWKQSGIGARLGGAHGIRKYCRTQVVTTPRVPFNAAPLLVWFPYTDVKRVLLSGALRFLGGRDLRRRLGI